MRSSPSRARRISARTRSIPLPPASMRSSMEATARSPEPAAVRSRTCWSSTIAPKAGACPSFAENVISLIAAYLPSLIVVKKAGGHNAEPDQHVPDDDEQHQPNADHDPGARHVHVIDEGPRR